MSGKTERVCEYCGKIFYKFPDPTKALRFCSKQCFYANSRVMVTCKHCNKEFGAQVSQNKIYCSTACMYEHAKKERPERACEYCQKLFTIRTGRQGKFCSIKCFQNAWSNQVTLICQGCSKEFVVQAYQAKTKKYCSPECRRQVKVISCICQYCGKEFEIWLSAFKQSGGKFCSPSCRSKWLSENTSGENHPLWKGGRVYYRGPNWLAQRKLALERDSFSCQYCGKSQPKWGNHHVHHIIPFREFNYVIGKNDNYKLANDLTNLITLCLPCHRKAEYGKIAIQPRLL